jgi:hypothetical protein
MDCMKGALGYRHGLVVVGDGHVEHGGRDGRLDAED